MKNGYEAPFLRMVDDRVEGVYAAGSGMVPPPPPKGDWDVYCEYRNHNSGSHSEVAIIGEHSGTSSGEGITMNFVIPNGFVLDTIKDSSGYVVTNVSENGFTVYRQGHFNPNERFEFNIQITAKDSQYHGSVGKTGDFLPCTIECNSYVTN